ncbi:MAG: alpha-E domain-containing protein [Bacteroidia bacterium]|nr:alpha-E domain-containing protein [Bacteroidia bacterium]
MLARVADSLFWIGRYIERSEHLARFTKIQYFSALDAPLSHKEDFVLASLIHMVGLDPALATMGEAEVLYRIGPDRQSEASICHAVSLARTNARGARDMLSAELWENLNKFYHFVINYPAEEYKTRGLYDFTHQVLVQCTLIKGAAENTLLHDEVWTLIQAGIYLERAIQVTRILRAKLADIARIEQTLPDAPAIEGYQISTLLSATEGFDMSRRFYKSEVNRQMALAFLVINPVFPRSLSYAMRKLTTYLSRIHQGGTFIEPGSVDFVTGKLRARLQFLTAEELMQDTDHFLAEILDQLYQIGGLIHETYLRY